MTDRHEDADARLARLRDASRDVHARPYFAQRVAAVIAREAPRADWLRDLLLPARRLVPIAVIAAVAFVVWATESAKGARVDRREAQATELDTQW